MDYVKGHNRGQMVLLPDCIDDLIGQGKEKTLSMSTRMPAGSVQTNVQAPGSTKP